MFTFRNNYQKNHIDNKTFKIHKCNQKLQTHVKSRSRQNTTRLSLNSQVAIGVSL